MENEVKTQKSNNIKLIVILLIILLVAGIAFIMLLITKPWDKVKNYTSTTTSTTTTTTEAVETVTITFDANGGEPVEPMVVKKGEQVKLPTTTKKGYIFNGWLDDNDDMPNDITSFDKDTKYTANWKPEETKATSMTITFDSKGGTKVSPVKYTCKDGGATIKLPKAPTKDFYEFRVWEDKHGTPILDGALLTCEDLTLYAAWEYDGPEANTEH